MKITVQQLRYLLKAVGSGSINAAAKQLSISKSTLSESLIQLESELGFSVLDRSKRGVVPTDKGFKVVRGAQRVVDEMDLFERQFCASDGATRTFSVLTLPLGFALNALMRVSGVHSGDVFNVEVAQNPRIAYEVSEGNCDIGILFLSEGNEGALRGYIDREQLDFHELFKTPYHVFMNKSHPLAGKDKVSLADLAPYPIFSYEEYFYLNPLRMKEMREALGEHDEARANEILFGSLRELMESIVEVNGYAIWCNILPSIPEGAGTVAIPLDSGKLMSLGYVVPRGTVVDGPLKEYVDAIMEYDEKK